jgi:hypothetical protein
MPLTAGVTVTSDADARCVPRRFVGVITATMKGTSHIERWRPPEDTGRMPTVDLVGNVVTACGESWLPATRNGLCRGRLW